MVRLAADWMREQGTDFLITGEVIGQRVASQKRADLDTVAFHAKVADLLLRPLSAKLLPETLPERQGWVRREQLAGIQGQSRKPQRRLASQLGLEWIPPETHGCLLTELPMAEKVFDLFASSVDANAWHLDLLKVGRHFRLSSDVKVVVGRRHDENQTLHDAVAHASSPVCVMLEPSNFKGPSALVTGSEHHADLELAAALILRYTRQTPENPAVRLVASHACVTAAPMYMSIARREEAERLQPVGSN
jgi:hypothetical protein